MVLLSKSIRVMLCIFSLPLAAIAPNQYSNNSNDGAQANNLKLAIGWAMENNEPHRVQMIQGQFEFFATDHFSIRGNSGLPVSTSYNNQINYPFMMGGALHFLPRYFFDFYLGADAGFVYTDTIRQQGAATWATRITGVAGVTLYYWGVFFLEGEAAYSVEQYGRDIGVDMSAPSYRVRIGFYL